MCSAWGMKRVFVLALLILVYGMSISTLHREIPYMCYIQWPPLSAKTCGARFK
jgi:hypothetical protein